MEIIEFTPFSRVIKLKVGKTYITRNLLRVRKVKILHQLPSGNYEGVFLSRKGEEIFTSIFDEFGKNENKKWTLLVK